MGHPVVHFEIIGHDPAKLRAYYGELFGWTFDTNAPVAKAVSEKGNYGFIDRNTTKDGVGIPGGVGGGGGYARHAIFYIGVPSVEAALKKAENLGGKRLMGPEKNPGGELVAENLGGKRLMGPEKNPGGELVVAHFEDPEGNVIGLAGPA